MIAAYTNIAIHKAIKHTIETLDKRSFRTGYRGHAKDMWVTLFDLVVQSDKMFDRFYLLHQSVTKLPQRVHLPECQPFIDSIPTMDKEDIVKYSVIYMKQILEFAKPHNQAFELCKTSSMLDTLDAEFLKRYPVQFALHAMPWNMCTSLVKRHLQFDDLHIQICVKPMLTPAHNFFNPRSV